MKTGKKNMHSILIATAAFILFAFSPLSCGGGGGGAGGVVKFKGGGSGGVVASGNLKVTVNIPGSNVIIDGADTGKTMTDTTTTISNIPVGTHSVSLSTLSGFRDIPAQNVSITSDSTPELEFMHIILNEKIYFDSERDSDFTGGALSWQVVSKIYRINPDGTGQTRISPEGLDVSEGFPSIAPDGTKIGYVKIGPVPYQIYTMNSSGSNKMQITTDQNTSAYPAYSYDGNDIFFHQHYKAIESCWIPLMCADIFSIDISSSNKIQYTNDQYHNTFPSISPDGKKVVYTSSRDIPAERYIYILDIESGTTTSLTNPEDDKSVDYPVFSPDGKMIAYQSSRSGSSDIWIMEIDGTRKTNITNDEYYDSQPTFSPNGTQIAFTSDRYNTSSMDERANYEICIVNIDGTNLTRLTTNPGIDEHPTWTP